MRHIALNRYISLVIVVCAALMGCHAWAAPITEGQARNIAANFMASHAMPSTNLSMSHKSPRLNAPGLSENAAYYAFNASRGGFVIVAGDDRVPAVLGYSDKSSFDPQNVPEAMQAMLDSYAAQIDALDHGAKAAVHLTSGSAIAPLVTAQWDQSEPYNILFPYLGRNRAYVGCVATAMAQVMYYWKWPVRTTDELPPYTSTTMGIYMPKLPIVEFDWDSMQDTYMMTDTSSQAALAAATLSLYCAQSVDMDFTPSGSGAMSHNIPIALYAHFGYSSTARYLQRSVYSTQVWEGMIVDELSASRPVLYSGSKVLGGHEFVCDGYDGNGMFHINWGWNGVSNGYFLLSVLDPDVQGAGSATGSYGYIENQGMVIGIKPSTGDDTPSALEVTTTSVEVKSYSETRASSTYNFSVSQTTIFMNCMNRPISFDYGWGLYDSSNRLIQKLSTSYINTMGSQYFINPTQTLMFGSGRSSGVYRIMPIYSERNTTNWRPCVGANINHIKVAITGNKCVVTAQGAGGIPSYEVNSINVTGNMHPNRPVNITLNVTNTGNSRNDLIYMFADGNFVSEAFLDMEKGGSGDIQFQYTSRKSGTIGLTFSLDRSGSDPIATQSIVIEPMPTANLRGTVDVLNVADARRNYILGNRFSLRATATNHGSTAYDEDITVRLYKQLIGEYGIEVQSQARTVKINPNQSVSVQFDLDNVTDGWTYYAIVYYYSDGRERSMGMSDSYTIFFTEIPSGLPGDVNGDGEVNIADVNAVIDVILGRTDPNNGQNADVDGNGEVNIGDVNAIIDIILNG